MINVPCLCMCVYSFFFEVLPRLREEEKRRGSWWNPIGERRRREERELLIDPRRGGGPRLVGWLAWSWQRDWADGGGREKKSGEGKFKRGRRVNNSRARRAGRGKGKGREARVGITKIDDQAQHPNELDHVKSMISQPNEIRDVKGLPINPHLLQLGTYPRVQALLNRKQTIY